MALSSEHTLDDLVDFYLQKRTRYLQAAEIFNRIFRYLNRHWIKRELEEGRKDVYEIEQQIAHLVTGIFDGALQDKVLKELKRLSEDPLRYSSIITKAGDYFIKFFPDSQSIPRRLYVETCSLNFHRKLMEMCTVQFSQRFPLVRVAPERRPVQKQIQQAPEQVLIKTEKMSINSQNSHAIRSPAVRHWSLRVEGAGGQWSSYEIKRYGRLFELYYQQGSNSSSRSGTDLTRHFVGYTFLNDDDIGKYGKQAASLDVYSY